MPAVRLPGCAGRFGEKGRPIEAVEIVQLNARHLALWLAVDLDRDVINEVGNPIGRHGVVPEHQPNDVVAQAQGEVADGFAASGDGIESGELFDSSGPWPCLVESIGTL